MMIMMMMLLKGVISHGPRVVSFSRNIMHGTTEKNKSFCFVADYHKIDVSCQPPTPQKKHTTIRIYVFKFFFWLYRGKVTYKNFCQTASHFRIVRKRQIVIKKNMNTFFICNLVGKTRTQRDHITKEKWIYSPISPSFYGYLCSWFSAFVFFSPLTNLSANKGK